MLGAINDNLFKNALVVLVLYRVATAGPILVALAGGIFSVVLGGVYMLAAYGLWYLRPWAWWLAAAVSVAGIVVSFGAIPWMVAWAAVLVYLVLVRQSFGDLGSPLRPLRA